jgi:hypothetical protein
MYPVRIHHPHAAWRSQQHSTGMASPLGRPGRALHGTAVIRLPGAQRAHGMIRFRGAPVTTMASWSSSAGANSRQQMSSGEMTNRISSCLLAEQRLVAAAASH